MDINKHKYNIFISRQTLLMIGLGYKQKCNNFGYLSIQVWLKGNDTRNVSIFVQILGINHFQPFLVELSFKTHYQTFFKLIKVGQIVLAVASIWDQPSPAILSYKCKTVLYKCFIWSYINSFVIKITFYFSLVYFVFPSFTLQFPKLSQIHLAILNHNFYLYPYLWD